MEGYEATLRREFDAEEGTFLLRLRGEMAWDREAFSRLAEAMEACAADHAGRPVLARWVAEGFWYVSWFVPQWAGHPAFPRPDEEYYSRACERLFDLASWLFTGDHPQEGGGPLEAL